MIEWMCISLSGSHIFKAAKKPGNKNMLTYFYGMKITGRVFIK